MRKHFDLDITAAAFGFSRKTAEIAAEAATDGLDVVRTNLAARWPVPPITRSATPL
jgi:hypothetical protein